MMHTFAESQNGRKVCSGGSQERDIRPRPRFLGISQARAGTLKYEFPGRNCGCHIPSVFERVQASRCRDHSFIVAVMAAARASQQLSSLEPGPDIGAKSRAKKL